MKRLESSVRLQRGSAALVVTLILFFVMTLLAAFAHRNHFFEHRSSANHFRAAQAQEAAEAGLEWATALLNDPHPIDAACTRHASGIASFREAFLSVEAGTQMVKPKARRAACVKTPGGWHCSCADTAHPVPDLHGLHSGMAFLVEFAAQSQPGTVALHSIGCSSLGGPCLPSGTAKTDAQAQMQVSLALFPGVMSAPVAPLTVRDDVRSGVSPIGLHNPSAAAGGFTVHAGGGFVAPGARLTTAAGSVAADSVIEFDEVLHGMPADRLFASVFGTGKAMWSAQPAVQRIRCGADCAAGVASALGATTGNRMLWIEGDLALDGPIDIGSPERPVVLVVDGALTLKGAVAIHGLVHAARMAWSGNDGVIRGAAVSASGYEGDASADFIRDAAILARLKASTGSFVRVPGSWRDF